MLFLDSFVSSDRMSATPRRLSFVRAASVALVLLLIPATLLSSARGAETTTAAATEAGESQKSLEECARLGYQREVIRCHYCETLFTHTGSASLLHECRSCCTPNKDNDEHEVEYTSATIVTPFLERLLTTPSYISRFVSSYEKEPYFKKLKIVDAGKHFSMPELVLLSNGKDELRIPLYNMEAHQLHELLQKKLKL